MRIWQVLSFKNGSMKEDGYWINESNAKGIISIRENEGYSCVINVIHTADDYLIKNEK